MRVGFGFDIHPLVKGKSLILGGVLIAFEKGLSGHSDADALCHAIADALLGAAALGDIGDHFPDSDSQYRDASSLILLKVIGEEIRQAGYKIINIDSTVVAEAPKILPYRREMIRNISGALEVDEKMVSIKATTHEMLDSIGQGQAIAAHAVVSLEVV